MRIGGRTCLVLFLLFCPFSAGMAGTGIYRCPQPDGRIQFQQTACRGGEAVALQPPSVVGMGGDRASSPAGRGSRQRSAAVSGRQGSRTDWQSGGSEACRKRRAHLDQVRNKLRRGYKASEGVRLHRQEEEDRAWLRQHC